MDKLEPIVIAMIIEYAILDVTDNSAIKLIDVADCERCLEKRIEKLTKDQPDRIYSVYEHLAIHRGNDMFTKNPLPGFTPVHSDN